MPISEVCQEESNSQGGVLLGRRVPFIPRKKKGPKKMRLTIFLPPFDVLEFRIFHRNNPQMADQWFTGRAWRQRIRSLLALEFYQCEANGKYDS
jgi:hypothetical protein